MPERSVNPSSPRQAPAIPLAGAIVELKIRRHATAEPQSLEVLVVPIRPTKAFAAATEASARVIERDGRRMGYVHIWSSTDAGVLSAALARIDPGSQPGDRSGG